MRYKKMTVYLFLFALFYPLLVDCSNQKVISTSSTLEKGKRSPTLVFLQKSRQPYFEVTALTKNLGTVWGMVFINQEDILFTEREGNIKILHTQSGQVSLVEGAPNVYAKGQGGLLDVVTHPQFSKNRKIYLSYSKAKGSKQTTVVAQAILQKRKITKLKDIFTAKPFLSASRHFGSRLVFDKNGFLYVTVGDRAHRHYAQKLDNHIGKILRLTDKGQAPLNNPFVAVQGALPEIWSYGHRNPQGLFIHPETDQLWSGEHGPRGGDEINLIKKGKNYGWPVITYGREYWGPAIGEGFQKKGMEQPVKYYTPSIAPSGLLIYSGKQFKQWKHSFFSGALVLRHLNRLEINQTASQVSPVLQPQIQKLKGAYSPSPKAGREERLLSSLNFRVRHVIEGPKGSIYVAVDGGQILRLKPWTKI